MGARMQAISDSRPCIAHVVYRFDVGGLENGVANLVNHLPSDRIPSCDRRADRSHRFPRADPTRRCAVLRSAQRTGPRISTVSSPFRCSGTWHRRSCIRETSLRWKRASPPGSPGFRPACMASTDATSATSMDRNRTYQRVRRVYRPFVTQYVALSKDLADICATRSVSRRRASRRSTTVSTPRDSRPRPTAGLPVEGCPFTFPSLWSWEPSAGWRTVKDPVTLARAFVVAVRRHPAGARACGSSWSATVRFASMSRRSSPRRTSTTSRGFPASAHDVPDILRGLDCFVLPSLAEGMSNTILEAMASGLPVVATRVGGNGELVDDGVTGRLVPPADPEALAARDSLPMSAIRQRGAPARARPRGKSQCSASASNGWSDGLPVAL